MKHSENSATAFGFDWIKGNHGINLPSPCSKFPDPHNITTVERDGRLVG